MLALSFFQWWYGPGWSRFISSWSHDVRRIWLGFSGPLLLRTLFSPWRRIITAGGGSFDQRMRAAVDNTVSRFVGLLARTTVVFAAVTLIGLRTAAAAVQTVAWPVLPFLPLVVLFAGALR